MMYDLPFSLGDSQGKVNNRKKIEDRINLPFSLGDSPKNPHRVFACGVGCLAVLLMRFSILVDEEKEIVSKLAVLLMRFGNSRKNG